MYIFQATQKSSSYNNLKSNNYIDFISIIPHIKYLSSGSDIEAPWIRCPENIETETLEHQNSANISWQIPIAEDNSGDEAS